MLGHKILWESVARIPRHKSALRAPSVNEFSYGLHLGPRDPIIPNSPEPVSSTLAPSVGKRTSVHR